MNIIQTFKLKREEYLEISNDIFHRIAKPIPLFPPVITDTLFSNLLLFYHLFLLSKDEELIGLWQGQTQTDITTL